MATIRLPNDFKEFLKLFNDHHVDYLLIGGYAVNYHGYPRATADIDLWIGVSPENAERVATAIREFGFAKASPELFQELGNVVRMGQPPIRIEVLNAVSGVQFHECFERGTVVDLDGIPVRIISLPDLKANKKASGRAKDLADLEELP
ncbi:MAG: nucleotidyltransferase [Acidobacteria bacterium]|nr:nucleotidyltransferase [Acidobacteriota bacterium]